MRSIFNRKSLKKAFAIGAIVLGTIMNYESVYQLATHPEQTPPETGKSILVTVFGLASWDNIKRKEKKENDAPKPG